jgi:hypothetical protein
VVTAAALIVVPATSASALALQCRYTPGMEAWIDAGGSPGDTCAVTAGGVVGGSHSGPGSVSGTSGNPGQFPAKASCLAGPKIPDEFYAHGPILTYVKNEPLPGGSVESRDYYRNGKFVGQSETRSQAGKITDVYFDDYSLTGGSFADPNGVVLHYEAKCTTGDVDDEAAWDPQIIAVDQYWPGLRAATALGIPGAPTPAAAPSEILTRAALAPVPFSPNKFFLRIDVINNKSTTSDADIEFDLNEFSLQGFLSMPGDASCPLATQVSERCTFPNIAPGATESMTFIVKANASTANTATLPIRTFFPGYVTIDSRGGIPWELVREGQVTTDKLPTP